MVNKSNPINDVNSFHEHVLWGNSFDANNSIFYWRNHNYILPLVDIPLGSGNTFLNKSKIISSIKHSWMETFRRLLLNFIHPNHDLSCMHLFRCTWFVCILLLTMYASYSIVEGLTETTTKISLREAHDFRSGDQSVVPWVSTSLCSWELRRIRAFFAVSRATTRAHLDQRTAKGLSRVHSDFGCCRVWNSSLFLRRHLKGHFIEKQTCVIVSVCCVLLWEAT